MKKVMIISLILFCCLCVPALAETVVIDDAGYNAAFGNYPSSSTNHLDSPKDLNALVFDKIHNCQEMRAFRAVGVGFGTSYSNAYYSFPDGPQSFSVEYRIGDTSVGYGRYGTFKVGDTGTIWMSFDSWDVSEYTGKKTVKIVKLDDDGVFPKIYRLCAYSSGGEAGSWNPDNFHKVWFDTSPQIMQPLLDCEVYYSDTFKNTYTIEFNEDWAELSLIRNIDGRAFASSLYVNTPVQTYSTGTILQTNDVQINYISGSPIDIGIKSASGVWYNRTFMSDFVGPTDPGDPTDSTTLTVYIKNSQTGALIANSNIVIDALVDGEYYPVVNRTEPSGIFIIYDLQPTGGGPPNPDGYRLIVTADGYNNPMPEINFTVDDYKQSIYCLLDPIAGGPADENKTFIDFFVSDMYANPISGATVKFGQYTLITNSAGYTVFEVPKNDYYTYTVSKSGYNTITGNANIGDAPRNTINTYLTPLITPPTQTPIPTGPPTGPTPVMTAPSGEPVSNWLEWFAAHFGMILGGGVEIGKIFMWLCFTVPVGVYVGKEAKAGAAGFMAGAGIVTLFFVLIGWVPIWLVVLLALIIGLLYAKVFNTQDNGGGR